MDNRYKTTFATWNKIASLYQEKFMDLDLYNDTYDLFCQLLEKSHPIVLEIGCGPGNITKYLIEKRPDMAIHGIDVAPNMIELARANNPKASFETMDCREIDKLTEKFDAIICGFCMPYLSKEDCAKLIKDCSSLLNSAGIAYFSVIEGDYSKSKYEIGSSGDKAYVYYHQEDELRKHLNEHSFKVVKLMRKHYPKRKEINETHLIALAEKVNA